jgi:hypothetical protein
VVSTQGSWQAGVNGARAGVFMPAEPKVGQVFKQEDAKNVAEDCAKIVGLNASVRTPFVSSNKALKTEEFSLPEPDVLDNKYYLRHIDLVREQTVHRARLLQRRRQELLRAGARREAKARRKPPGHRDEICAPHPPDCQESQAFIGDYIGLVGTRRRVVTAYIEPSADPSN